VKPERIRFKFTTEVERVGTHEPFDVIVSAEWWPLDGELGWSLSDLNGEPVDDDELTQHSFKMLADQVAAEAMERDNG